MYIDTRKKFKKEWFKELNKIQERFLNNEPLTKEEQEYGNFEKQV